MPVDLTQPLDPLSNVVADVADFLKNQTGGEEINLAYCQPNGDGLFVALKGATEHRFSLHRLDQATKNERTSDSDASRTYTVGQLLRLDLPPRKALIEGMLHAGETIAIVGRQKVGKSRIVQQMALSLANAEPFLGMPIASCARTLMIDLENGLPSLQGRFKAMSGSRSGDDMIHVWCAASLAADLPDASEEGAHRLRAIVNDIQPDVLIVDPWRLWLAGGDENDARDVVRGLKVLASLRQERRDLTIVIVHHLRKERYENPKRLLQEPALWVDAVSGHHALMGHTDAVFGLERQPDDDGNQVVIFGGIARSVEPPTLILQEDESLRFSVIADESAALQVMTPVEREIWKHAQEIRKFSFTDLLVSSGTKNKKAVSSALRHAQGHGLLRKDGKTYVVLDAA
jgi:hypothetical protein